MNYIALKDCIAGDVYELHSRNLSTGVYDGKHGFIGIRLKFSDRYLFTEYHHDDGPPYGTVKPIKRIGSLPSDIAIDQHLSGIVNGKRIDSWARRDKKLIPVVRRDLLENEPQHGSREGFVDEWADTGERLPDCLYPHLLGNEALFKFLDSFTGE